MRSYEYYIIFKEFEEWAYNKDFKRDRILLNIGVNNLLIEYAIN
jgi:hypothetical protein